MPSSHYPSVHFASPSLPFWNYVTLLKDSFIEFVACLYFHPNRPFWHHSSWSLLGSELSCSVGHLSGNSKADATILQCRSYFCCILAEGAGPKSSTEDGHYVDFIGKACWKQSFQKTVIQLELWQLFCIALLMGNFPNHGVKANPLTIWHSLVSTNKVQVLGEFVWVIPDQRS